MTDRQRIAARLAFVAGTVNRRLRPGLGELSHIAVSALASVSRCGAVRPGDLARVEGMSAPGMTRLLADLEQQGLVARTPDPNDRRAHLVSLTAHGAAALDRARAARTVGVLDLLDGTSDEQLDQLSGALDVLERALQPRVPA